MAPRFLTGSYCFLISKEETIVSGRSRSRLYFLSVDNCFFFNSSELYCRDVSEGLESFFLLVNFTSLFL